MDFNSTDNVMPFASFRSDDSGAVTVATVIWFPFFIFVLMLIFDIAMIFHGQARAHEVAEDINRALSIGEISSFSEAESRARSALVSLSANVTASTTAQDQVIRTVVTIPTRDLTAGIGVVAPLSTFNITAVAQMVQEF